MHKYNKSILFRQNEILFYKSYSFECFNKLKAKEKQNKANENQSHSFKNQNTKKKKMMILMGIFYCNHQLSMMCFLVYLHLSQTDKRLASSHFSGWRRWWVWWGTVVKIQWTRCESVSTSLIAALTPEWTACLRWSAWPQSTCWFQRIKELLLLVLSLHKLKIHI